MATPVDWNPQTIEPAEWTPDTLNPTLWTDENVDPPFNSFLELTSDDGFLELTGSTGSDYLELT